MTNCNCQSRDAPYTKETNQCTKTEKTSQMFTGGRFTMNITPNLRVGIEVLSPHAKHALAKDLASLIIQTSTVKELFSSQMRNVDVKEGVKQEINHKFQRQNPEKEKGDDTDSNIEVLTEHETKKLSKAVRTVKEKLEHQAQPHHRLPFEYDSFMEEMLGKAKKIKKDK